MYIFLFCVSFVYVLCGGLFRKSCTSFSVVLCFCLSLLCVGLFYRSCAEFSFAFPFRPSLSFVLCVGFFCRLSTQERCPCTQFFLKFHFLGLLRWSCLLIVCVGLFCRLAAQECDALVRNSVALLRRLCGFLLTGSDVF